MRSFFTYRQWRWVKERYDEGYSMEALSEFLGINRRSIRTAFVRLGFYPGIKADLPPLSKRQQEFLELAKEDDLAPDSPVEAGRDFEAIGWSTEPIGSAGRASRSPD